jgi:5-methylcytosine-specific restriction endonuclease McrA
MPVKMNSEKWKRARQICRARAGNKCELCKKKGSHVHHKIAKSVGGPKYKQSNLQFLCQSCHKKIHKTYRPWEDKTSYKAKRTRHKRHNLNYSNKRTGTIKVVIKKYRKKTYKVKICR